MIVPELGVRNTNDFDKTKIFMCPSYPVKEQLICYVINAFHFASPTDMAPVEEIVGSNPGFTKITSVQRPVDTIYFADYEYSSASQIITNVILPIWVCMMPLTRNICLTRPMASL